MTIIFGQIDSLKKLKSILNENNISRFKSIGDINKFKKNFELERKQIPETITSSLNSEIEKLEFKIQCYIEKKHHNILYRVVYWLSFIRNTHTKNYLKKHYKKVHKKRCASLYEKLDFTKKLIDEQYPLIAGAIGENKVVTELKNLTDDFYLINDFFIRFTPPLYNRKTQDSISSIQIDHLLIARSGVFIIETKNWSKASINSLSLRSPVSQIKRSSYALFCFLNNESSLTLNKHHWGSKKIPIRSIIAMANAKPKEEFQHVKVLSIAELNGYITYFDNIFTNEECESLFEYLKQNKQDDS